MQTYNDVHRQFAEFFPGNSLKPFLYLVSKSLSEGHICLNLEELKSEIKNLPEEYSRLFEGSHPTINLNEIEIFLAGQTLISSENGNKQPFILHLKKLYLERYFAYETTILRKIQGLMDYEAGYYDERLNELRIQKQLINSLFPGSDLVFFETFPEVNDKIKDLQFLAAITAVLNNFTIITGGPGTGKTTTVAKVLSLLFAINPNLKVALAAPTGKAAFRMAESLKNSELNLSNEIREKINAIVPLTIHRLLGPVMNSPYFKHNSKNKLDADIIIIDESSMIDVALFAKLLDSIKSNSRLILLGDKNQLASIEAGSLLADLCQTQATHVLSSHIIELKQSHRFSDEKGIGRFSKAIITNNPAIIQEFIHTKQIEVVIEPLENKVLLESFARNYELYIQEPDIRNALYKFNKFRVLCAVRDGNHGLYNVNSQIENYLKHRKAINNFTEFYENRPIIITRNYHALGLFNGDVGITRYDANKVLKVWFVNAENKLIDFLPGLLADSETVFAMTIHKSQGSEYDEVLVIFPGNSEAKILTRELLYTAVTRARKKVYLLADEKSILDAAEKQVKRASGITARFEAKAALETRVKPI